MGRVYVVVTGPPGSGKSTLARSLADELDLPLLAKETVKQALLDEQRLPVEELWPEDALRPLAGGWPVVEVDTSGPVDVRDVAERVRRTRSRR